MLKLATFAVAACAAFAIIHGQHHGHHDSVPLTPPPAVPAPVTGWHTGGAHTSTGDASGTVGSVGGHVGGHMPHLPGNANVRSDVRKFHHPSRIVHRYRL